jgi:N-acetylglucosamine kinase-like BadF-type ATPase
MSAGVFVGIDSGGTRTNVEILVSDANGNRRSASYESAESLSGALAPSLIPNVLGKILAPLPLRLEDLAIDDLPMYVWISAAGFTPWTRDEFTVAIHDSGPAIGYENIHSMGVANDAVSLLLGSRANGIIIAGTGSSVIVKASDGSLHQSGGHEWVACDYGSGFWLGLGAIRQAYRDFEAGSDSVLLQRLRQVYGIRPNDTRALIAKLRDLAIADPNMKKEIARFAASVCAAAERGDVDAQNIVKLGAEDLADVTAGALRRQFPMDQLVEGIGLVQCGSLLGNQLYRSSFESQIEMRLSSGIEQRVAIDWQRVTTASAACIQLARDLAGDTTDLLRLDMSFRPSIVIF